MSRQRLNSVLNELGSAVGEARLYFSELDGEAIVRPAAWGPAEVLSHLVYWHGVYLEGLESLLAGEPPFGAHETIDDLNARALEKMAGSRVVDLLTEWEDLQQRLDERARAMPDPKVAVPVYSDGTEHSLIEPIQELAGHINEHLEELKDRD